PGMVAYRTGAGGVSPAPVDVSPRSADRRPTSSRARPTRQGKSPRRRPSCEGLPRRGSPAGGRRPLSSRPCHRAGRTVSERRRVRRRGSEGQPRLAPHSPQTTAPPPPVPRGPQRPRPHRKNQKRSTPPTHIKIGTARMTSANTSQTPKKARWNVRPFWAHSGQIAVPRTQLTSSSLSMTQPQEPHLIATSLRSRRHDPSCPPNHGLGRPAGRTPAAQPTRPRRPPQGTGQSFVLQALADLSRSG